MDSYGSEGSKDLMEINWSHQFESNQPIFSMNHHYVEEARSASRINWINITISLYLRIRRIPIIISMTPKPKKCFMCCYYFNRDDQHLQILISSITITRISSTKRSQHRASWMDRWILVARKMVMMELCLSSSSVHLHDEPLRLLYLLRIAFSLLNYLEPITTIPLTVIFFMILHVSCIMHHGFKRHHAPATTQPQLCLNLYHVAGEDAWPFKEGGISM